MNEIISLYVYGNYKISEEKGSWAYKIFSYEKSIERTGSVANTTSNRMELTAAIIALQEIISSSWYYNQRIIVYANNQYLSAGMEKWIENWENSGWNTKSKNQVKNLDLWRQLLECDLKMKISWRYLDQKNKKPVQNLKTLTK
jgi:ribonuclease HI